MIWMEVLILAVVQGISEFLPISSSGHVVVGAAVFDQLGYPLKEKLTVNIVLHLGTLLAILVFYRRRIWRLLRRDRRVIALLAVGSIPTAAVGVLVNWTQFGAGLRAALEDADTIALLAGFMFPLTGLMLLCTARRPVGQTDCRELGYGHAVLIGIFQALATLPGISRSGATIVAGLGCGLRRDEAATFSFLLAIPTIAGVGLLQVLQLLADSAETTPRGGLALGALVSFAVGLASLWWLVRWLDQGRLHLFAWWVIPLGLVVIAWQLLL